MWGNNYSCTEGEIYSVPEQGRRGREQICATRKDNLNLRDCTQLVEINSLI